MGDWCYILTSRDCTVPVISHYWLGPSKSDGDIESRLGLVINRAIIHCRCELSFIQDSKWKKPGERFLFVINLS